MPRKHAAQRHIPYTPQWHTQACTQKQRYPNQLAATRAAELKTLEQPDLALSVYRCSRCHGWHLTRRPDTARA